jgi:hypothetical protein
MLCAMNVEHTRRRAVPYMSVLRLNRDAFMEDGTRSAEPGRYV